MELWPAMAPLPQLRMRCRALVLVAASSLALPSADAGGAAGPVVLTPLGRVQGVDYGDFVAFKGLPYAEKAERFRAPRAKRPWDKEKVLDATHFGDACVGGGGHQDHDPLESYGESEDCLYANVWKPKQPAAGKLPVVVWIHGGGFMVRTGNFAGYWGDGLVTNAELPAILVSFNYRLGIFGFYSSSDTEANFGFQDQQELLRWVSQNIAAFGGDPSRVTLTGQSAGAMSVLCHLVAPASRELFHRAVAFSPVGLHYRNLTENEPFGRTVSSAVGCDVENRTACLLQRPYWALKAADIVPEYLLHWEGHCAGCDNLLPWMPVVDGSILPLQPLKAIELGKHARVPTLISTTRNETLAFVPTLLVHLTNRETMYKVALEAFFGSSSTEVGQHYANSPDTAQMASREFAHLIGLITTDALMTCYARYTVRALSRHAPAFLSTFMLAPHNSMMHADKVCVAGPPHGASCHAADVAFFLPSTLRMAARSGVGYATPDEARSAHKFSAEILRFAHGDKASIFLPYNPVEDVSAAWDLDGPYKVRGYHKSHCDFFESIGFPRAPWGAAASASEAAPPRTKLEAGRRQEWPLDQWPVGQKDVEEQPADGGPADNFFEDRRLVEEPRFV